LTPNERKLLLVGHFPHLTAHLVADLPHETNRIELLGLLFRGLFHTYTTSAEFASD
jgi:hypothetical protein